MIYPPIYPSTYLPSLGAHGYLFACIKPEDVLSICCCQFTVIIMILLKLQILLVLVWVPIVYPDEAFDPIIYYPTFTYFENQHLPYVASVGCKELKADGITDTEVNINTASLTFTSENLPAEIPAGQTYAYVQVQGTIVENTPDSYNFHYELFIMCPKCDPAYYINDEPWTTCRTEYESIDLTTRGTEESCQ